MYVVEDSRKFAERFEVIPVCWLEVREKKENNDKVVLVCRLEVREKKNSDKGG